MTSVGLVCSAGGPRGDPWHSGVVSRLFESTGFDARTSDLVVGTSAGSFTGSALRAGLSPADCAARFTSGGEMTDEGKAIVDRILTSYTETEVDRPLKPSAVSMAAHALWPPWRLDPIRFGVAMLPKGQIKADAMASRIDELLPQGWPYKPLWIVAVRTNDGKRIVFGRDDVTGTVGEACQASSAIPGRYHPVTIGARTYIDGAVHSSTNADLVAMLGFDLVIVSSVMTAAPGASGWLRDSTRAWFSTRLQAEISSIRSGGTAVVVIEPDEKTLRGFATTPVDGARLVDAGRVAVDRLLGGPEGGTIASVLARTAYAGSPASAK